MPKIDSPVRRVLADKSINASLQLQSPTRKTSTKPEQWQPQLPPQTTTQRPFTTERRFPPLSPRAGQKRRIAEVEGSSLHDNNNGNDGSQQQQQQQQSQTSTQPLSQVSQLFSDSGSERDVSSSLFDSRIRSATTRTSSFLVSQEAPLPMELHFEIQEEVSQHTLDKMHAVSLPQNTSQLVPALRSNLDKENSQLSVSMSSLIDFDSENSEGDDAMKLVIPPPKLDSEVALPPNPTVTNKVDQERKALLKEKAEILRTRLKLAYYKVNTNQTTKPFSRLSVPKRTSSPPIINIPYSSSPPPESSSPPHHSSTPRPFSSPESRIALARARATMQQKPSVRPLDTLAIPTILPTAFSARWNESSDATISNVPSSPPLSNNSGVTIRAPVIMDSSSPRRATKRARRSNNDSSDSRSPPRTPIQLSSPPQSPDGLNISDDADIEERRQRYSDRGHGGLTSSVVKSEAATGLLELMRSDPRSGVGSTHGAANT